MDETDSSAAAAASNEQVFFLGTNLSSLPPSLSSFSHLLSLSLASLPPSFLSLSSTMFSFLGSSFSSFFAHNLFGTYSPSEREREREREREGRKIGWAEWWLRGKSGGNKNTHCGKPENRPTDQQPTPFLTAMRLRGRVGSRPRHKWRGRNKRTAGCCSLLQQSAVRSGEGKDEKTREASETKIENREPMGTSRPQYRS